MRTIISSLRDAFLIIIGILSAGLGLKGFLLPNDFIDGGVTGTSMLLSTLFDIPLWLLILLLNAPFLILGYRQVSEIFSIKSVFAILGLATCILFIEYPVVTDDKILASVFGGFFLGAGIGLSIRAGSVLDGTEIMAILISKNLQFTIGDVILLVNIVIFSVAAVFLGVEIAMYSILTYLTASKTVDFIVLGLEEYTGIIIVSKRSGEIKEQILKKMGRGVTVYKGEGAYTREPQDILFTVVTRLEIGKTYRIIRELDEEAFVITQPVSDTKGGMIKKRVYH